MNPEKTVEFGAVYAELSNGSNLIAPFYVVGCYIPFENYEKAVAICSHWKIPSYLEYSDFKKYKSYILQARSLRCKMFTYTVEAFEVETLDLGVAATRGIKAAKNYLSLLGDEVFILASSSLTFLDVRSKNLLYISDIPYNNPHFAIAIAFARFRRILSLKRLKSQYPYLAIEKHGGNSTEIHYEKLSKLKLLPPCYINSKAFENGFRFLKKPYPPWYLKYIKDYYECFSN